MPDEFCTQCGAPVGPDAQFCTQCGAKPNRPGPRRRSGWTATDSIAVVSILAFMGGLYFLASRFSGHGESKTVDPKTIDAAESRRIAGVNEAERLLVVRMHARADSMLRLVARRSVQDLTDDNLRFIADRSTGDPTLGAQLVVVRAERDRRAGIAALQERKVRIEEERQRAIALEEQRAMDAEIRARVPAEQAPRPRSRTGDTEKIQALSRPDWYIGGTLNRSSIPAWRSADYANRLASASDCVAAAYPDLPTMDQVKVRAIALEACVTEAASGGDADGMDVAEVAAACMLILEDQGW